MSWLKQPPPYDGTPCDVLFGGVDTWGTVVTQCIYNPTTGKWHTGAAILDGNHTAWKPSRVKVANKSLAFIAEA